MTPVNFLELVSLHQGIVLIFCAMLLLAYLVIYRSGISSVADPLFLGVIASAFSASVIAILVYLEEIEDFYLISFLVTESIFVAATLSCGVKSLKLRKIIPTVSEDSWYLIFHYSLVATFLVATSIYLWRVGLPLFQTSSRLITFQELGLLTWVLEVTWVGVPLSVLLKRNFLSKKNIFDYFLLSLSFFLFATKGGKSDIVYILFVFHVFSQVTGATSTKRFESVLLWALPAMVVVVTSVVLTTWGVEASAFKVVLERFLLFGDVFFMGYNHSFLATIPDIGFFEYFFGGIKASIYSILGYDSNERFVLGYAISEYYYGIGEGIGPNARHNILGLVLWGPVFGVLFSALCGGAFLLCRRFVFWSGCGIFSLFIYCIINVYAWVLFIDPSLAIGYLLKIAVVISPLVVCAYGLNFLLTFGRYSELKIGKHS